MTQPPQPTDPPGPARPADGPYPSASTPPPAAAAPPPYAPPVQNPYGGPVLSDPYARAGSGEPGSLGYVQAHFGPVASFGDRVLALLVDVAVSLASLVPMLLSIPFFIAGAPEQTGYDAYGSAEFGDADTAMLVTGILLIVSGFLLGLGIQLWNRVFRMGRRGQSIGKGVVGLMLLDTRTGRPIGAGMCFVREVVGGLVNQLFYLSYLWMLWDEDRQTVADKAAHSTVVKVPKA